MTDIAMEPGAAKAPMSFWIVAVLSLVWNGFGATDYTMTRLRNEAWLAASGANPADMLAYIDKFPLLADIGWGLGVWGSFAGSLLLLARSRHAVAAFVVSLVGAVVSFGYQLTTTPPAGFDTPMNKAMPFVILAIVALLWWFARRSLAKGILR
jgi:hypothetical protein